MEELHVPAAPAPIIAIDLTNDLDILVPRKTLAVNQSLVRYCSRVHLADQCRVVVGYGLRARLWCLRDGDLLLLA